VLFDMDGVLCESETISRLAAAEAMRELYGIDADPSEFAAFTGMGEAIFLGGVCAARGVTNFDAAAAKAKFFEVYLSRYCVPGADIACAGARDLVAACRAAGLRTAVASSADLVKVHANLAAADIPLSMFDAVVSADAFENLKPAPDIFLAAAAELDVAPAACVVIEDAVAGVQAARAARMRVVGVTTTLPEAALRAAGPDMLRGGIGEVGVEDLRALRLRPGAFEPVVVAAV
jgi:HAD superfamily hydrolase (TIGR01509 family)